MTTTDYAVAAASAALILTVAAHWWRRASRATRIAVTEMAWWNLSLWICLYAWSVIAAGRPDWVNVVSQVALGAVWLGVLLPIVFRRIAKRRQAAEQRDKDRAGQ